MNFIFKNKKYLFVDCISNMCSCAILFFNLFVFSYYHLIQYKTITINKLTKHNNHKWLVM